MTKLTKKDIDELTRDLPSGPFLTRNDVIENLYTAIGLNADGTPLPPPPMQTTYGWAIVATKEGELCVSECEKLRFDGPYAIYRTPPPINPDVADVRRLAKIEIREIT